MHQDRHSLCQNFPSIRLRKRYLVVHYLVWILYWSLSSNVHAASSSNFYTFQRVASRSQKSSNKVELTKKKSNIILTHVDYWTSRLRRGIIQIYNPVLKDSLVQLECVKAHIGECIYWNFQSQDPLHSDWTRTRRCSTLPVHCHSRRSNKSLHSTECHLKMYKSPYIAENETYEEPSKHDSLLQQKWTNNSFKLAFSDFMTLLTLETTIRRKVRFSPPAAQTICKCNTKLKNFFIYASFQFPLPLDFLSQTEISHRD